MVGELSSQLVGQNIIRVNGIIYRIVNLYLIICIIMSLDIAIADDHSLFKQGIEAILKFTPDMNLVIKASNGEDLLHSIKASRPDVVLLDLRMPVMDGLSTLPILKRCYPQIKVIVLTLIEDDQTIAHALQNGAVAYLSKIANPDIIIKTIRECCPYTKGMSA